MSTERSWTEYFRVITPVLVTIAIFMLGNLISTTDKIDDKLFKHLTNDELHVIRGTVVSRGEFDIVTKMREAQFTAIYDKLAHLEALCIRAIDKGAK